jgi:hypothetical protein
MMQPGWYRGPTVHVRVNVRRIIYYLATVSSVPPTDWSNYRRREFQENKLLACHSPSILQTVSTRSREEKTPRERPAISSQSITIIDYVCSNYGRRESQKDSRPSHHSPSLLQTVAARTIGEDSSLREYMHNDKTINVDQIKHK